MQLTTDDRRKMLYRCRRGTQELSCILLEFFDNHLLSLPMNEQLVFRDLLEIEDTLLTDWLYHHVVPPTQEFKQIINTVLLSRSGKKP